ncbi:MAG TPA: metal-dependent transcriptional regulator [Chloroflexia bacterium]|nr:metal-dependent transcriptional regulator [Chloroflexia bacterium]
MTSATVEDYLKTIYLLQQEAQTGGAWLPGHEPLISTSALAERLDLAPASVTSMMGRLAHVELVTYTPYQGVRLTPQGEKMALRVVRRHRLLELYLAEKLGLSWDQVHAEAERLEHHISPTLEDRIAAALGNPQVDPHGHPIPTVAGEVASQAGAPLDTLPLGAPALILSVGDGDPELLRYLAARGMYPGARLLLTEREPFGGSLHVRVGPAEACHEYTLSLSAAARVRVTPGEE